MGYQEDYGFIYITENLINGKQYIGQNSFSKYHKTYLGSGILLKKAIKRYGRKNFLQDIIEVCGSKKELDAREKFWINYYDAVNDDMFYNLDLGGNTAFHSEKTIEKIRLSNTGYVVRQETKDKLSNLYRGVQIHKRESKISIGEKSIGRGAKKVIQKDFENNIIQIWDSAKTVCDNMGYNRGHISACCKGKRPSANGFLWEYHSAEDNTVAQKIIQKDYNEKIIKTWNSAHEINLQLGFSAAGIRRCCRCYRDGNSAHKTAFGYKWEYAS